MLYLYIYIFTYTVRNTHVWGKCMIIYNPSKVEIMRVVPTWRIIPLMGSGEQVVWTPGHLIVLRVFAYYYMLMLSHM